MAHQHRLKRLASGRVIVERFARPPRLEAPKRYVSYEDLPPDERERPMAIDLGNEILPPPRHVRGINGA